MTVNIPRLIRNTGLLAVAGMLVLITQKVGLGMPILDAVPGMIIIIGVADIALVNKRPFSKINFSCFRLGYNFRFSFQYALQSFVS